MFRSDRNFAATRLSTGGGVLLALRNRYKVSPVNVDNIRYAFPGIDLICCKALFANIVLFVFTLYIPSATTIED